MTRIPAHILPVPVSRCVFCNSTELTREHVFPQWTHRYLGAKRQGRDMSLRGIRYVNRDDLHPVKLPGAAMDLQVKCVCGKTRASGSAGAGPYCNGGWMSDLENLAKPVLTPLMEGREATLSSSDQRTIAGWAALRSVITEYALGGYPLTDKGQRTLLMRRKAPPDKGWGVWIGHYERQSSQLELSNYPFLVGKGKRTGDRSGYPILYNSGTSTQIFGKLYIHVVHCAWRGFVDELQFPPSSGGMLRRIWPLPGHDIHWPREAMTDADAEAIADFVSNRLVGIMRKTPGAP